MEIKLNKEIYSKEHILESIEDFKEIAEIRLINNEYTLNFELKDKDLELNEVKNEFLNYLLSKKQNNKNSIENENKTSNEYKEVKFKDKIIYNFYRKTKINDKILITTDNGSWIFLSQEEFKIFEDKKVDKNSKLYEKLVEKRIIINPKNLNLEIKSCREKKDFLFEGPSLHIIVLTLRCNLKCIYCHANSKPENQLEFDLNHENARKIVNLIFESPSESITIEFQGGEPLLNFEMLKYITNYAKEKNKVFKKELIITVVSNFTQLDEEKLDFLINNDVSICTSLDGPENLHNTNRQEYQKTVYWIKRIKEEYKKRNIKSEINAIPTITRESIKYPKKLIDEYLKNDLNSIFYRLLNNLGAATENASKIYYSPEDYLKFWETSIEYILDLNKKGIKFKDNKTSIILKKLFNKYDPNYCELRSPCGAVTGQLLYHYDGSVYTCDEGRMISDEIFKVGDVNDSYAKITTNPESCSIIASSINDIHHCNYCVYKPFCGLCPVLNYANTGSTIANIPNSEWCKIHKNQIEYVFKKIEESEENLNIFMKWI